MDDDLTQDDDPFDLCRKFGVQVVQTCDVLPLPVMFDRAHGVAFVSSDVKGDSRGEAADRLLSIAIGASPRT